MIYLFVYFVLALPYQAFTKFYLLEEKKRELALKKKKDDDDDDDDTTKTTSNKDSSSSTTTSSIDFRKIKYYNTNDSIALIGDRWVGQFVEYSFVFLTLLWIHAIFVNNAHTQSIYICVLYSISRLYYPFVFNKQNVYPGVLVSAIPNYFIILYLSIRIIYYTL